MGRSRQSLAARSAAPAARSICCRVRRVAHCGIICPAPILSAVKEKGSTMIMREQSPVNLEMPFATLDGFITPKECFYVRNYFPTPQLDAKAWRSNIKGAVGRMQPEQH